MQQQQQSNAWIWRHLPHPAPPDGTAEVEFKPLNGIGAQERPRSFQIQGSWVELSKLKSSVTGKVYHLSYVTYTAQGGIYQATVYDNSNNPVETWAVKRMDAPMVERRQVYAGDDRRPIPSLENPTTEVHAMRELGNRNPNLQSIHEYLRCDGDFPMYFMVVPYAGGGDLLDFLKQRGRAPRAKEVFEIAQQLLNGLTHMHLNGLCHMDISPENVLFVPGQFRFVLHDFGLATDSPQIEADALKPYDRRGKASYWAPEVFSAARDHPYDGFKADIHSLGCTLFTLCCYRCPPAHPHRPDFRDFNRMREILTQNSLNGNNPEEEKQLGDLIMEMVQDDPNKRPSLEYLLRKFSVVDRLDPPVDVLSEQLDKTKARQQAYINQS